MDYGEGEQVLQRQDLGIGLSVGILDNQLDQSLSNPLPSLCRMDFHIFYMKMGWILRDGPDPLGTLLGIPQLSIDGPQDPIRRTKYCPLPRHLRRFRRRHRVAAVLLHLLRQGNKPDILLP